jgi:hypothetical protein
MGITRAVIYAWRAKAMQNFWKLILTLVIAWIVWQIIKGLVLTAVHLAITIAVIAVLVWMVSAIYKSLTREKLKY